MEIVTDRTSRYFNLLFPFEHESTWRLLSYKIFIFHQQLKKSIDFIFISLTVEYFYYKIDKLFILKDDLFEGIWMKIENKNRVLWLILSSNKCSFIWVFGISLYEEFMSWHLHKVNIKAMILEIFLKFLFFFILS